MNVNFVGSTQLVKPQQKKVSQPAFCAAKTQGMDMVSFAGSKEAKDKGPQLSVMKNLAKGFVKPIKDIAQAVVNAPLATGAIVAATAATIHFVPVIGTLLAVGVASAGAIKIISSVAQAFKAKKGGDIEKAQKEIRDVGEGAFDVALTANAAIKGIKEVSGTVRAILEASKSVANEGKAINLVQKLYAIIKQVQTDKAVINAPKKFDTMVNTLKKDGVAEFALLKDAFKIKKSSKDIEAMISKVKDAGKKEELIKLLDAIKDATPKTNSAKYVDQIAGILKSEGITNVNTAQLIEIIETIREEPAVLAVVKGAMKVGTVDDAARAINKVIGKSRFSDDAVKVAVTSEMVENDK